MRPRNRQYAGRWKKPTPEQLAARLERATERRLAAPAPYYPAERAPGTQRGFVWVQLDGVDTIATLHQGPAPKGRRPRCDSLQSRDGARILATGGLHAICRQLVQCEVPAPMSRRALATLQAAAPPALPTDDQ